MTHLADRPQAPGRNHNYVAHNPGHDRPVGNGALRAVDVSVARPGAKDSEKKLSLTERLQQGTRGAVINHFNRVRDLNKSQGGEELTMNANTVQLAYISLAARLKDERIRGEMTPPQIMLETMAKAVLFAPKVSDALKTPNNYRSKEDLSQYNDILAEIIDTLPNTLQPGFKTAVIDNLRLESMALNKKIGHSSEISGKDQETGAVRLASMMYGASLEHAPKRAMAADSRLMVVTPNPEDYGGINLDLKGIDMIVTRPEDGVVIDIDTKASGKYLSTLAKLQGVDKVDQSVAPPYYFTGIHEITGHPHYLLNANSFSQIPAENFDFTPAGQEKVRRMVHEMLDGRAL